MKKFKFSIITVCLNSEKFLKRCINSVKNQNYTNYEHIIIDGGSNDNTLKIIEKNKNYFSKIVSNKDNGIWDAMNKGLELSSGDLICFLNSDDFYYPHALELINSYFNKYNVDFLFGSVKKYKIMHGYQPWKINFSFGFYSSHSVGFFIKRAKHLQVGYYDTKFLSADLNFFYKMISQNNLVGISTKKYEVIGEFEPGGFSSKINYIEHLKDLNKIRIHNGQSKILVYLLYIIKILKKPLKFIKSI